MFLNDLQMFVLQCVVTYQRKYKLIPVYLQQANFSNWARWIHCVALQYSVEYRVFDRLFFILYIIDFKCNSKN